VRTEIACIGHVSGLSPEGATPSPPLVWIVDAMGGVSRDRGAPADVRVGGGATVMSTGFTTPMLATSGLGAKSSRTLSTVFVLSVR
jgi:hypothetical protein